jgi:hypothetical protein
VRVTALPFPDAVVAVADAEVVEKVFPFPSWDEGLLLLVLGVEVVRARCGVAGDGRGEPGLLAKNNCSWKRLLSFGRARTVGSSESKESICLFRLLSIEKLGMFVSVVGSGKRKSKAMAEALKSI